MNKIQFAAYVLEIEANCALLRASMLLNDETKAIAHMIMIRKKINRLIEEVINPDENKLYLSKGGF